MKLKDKSSCQGIRLKLRSGSRTLKAQQHITRENKVELQQSKTKLNCLVNVNLYKFKHYRYPILFTKQMYVLLCTFIKL